MYLVAHTSASSQAGLDGGWGVAEEEKKQGQENNLVQPPSQC